ncbi:MAG: hypothetical protein IH934_07630 [Nanoarchaeota archaeon]|nr:hypothetical protein [Nanoarchaeota archaeon]
MQQPLDLIVDSVTAYIFEPVRRSNQEQIKSRVDSLAKLMSQMGDVIALETPMSLRGKSIDTYYGIQMPTEVFSKVQNTQLLYNKVYILGVPLGEQTFPKLPWGISKYREGDTTYLFVELHDQDTQLLQKFYSNQLREISNMLSPSQK